MERTWKRLMMPAWQLLTMRGELEPSESEDTLPGISIVSTLGLITLIAFLRRKSHV